MTDLPPGSYRAVATGVRGGQAVRAIDVRPGTIARVEMRLQ
jgi:hypothetical protein